LVIFLFISVKYFPILTVPATTAMVSSTPRRPSASSSQAHTLGGETTQPKGGVPPAVRTRESAESVSGESTSSAKENGFSSTKFFSCIGLEESQLLYEKSEKVRFAPGEVLFRQGDDSSTGVYVVLEGEVGVFLQEGKSAHPGGRMAPPLMTNTLSKGESVGDLDVVDGMPRFIPSVNMLFPSSNVVHSFCSLQLNTRVTHCTRSHVTPKHKHTHTRTLACAHMHTVWCTVYTTQ
jgi:hypothetical protein